MSTENQSQATSDREIKQLEVRGYKFTVDTDLLDDVDTFEIVDRIENEGRTASIIKLLQLLLGKKAYLEMKQEYARQDAEEHKGVPDYVGRFRLSVMGEVYQAIIKEFNPKG